MYQNVTPVAVCIIFDQQSVSRGCRLGLHRTRVTTEGIKLRQEARINARFLFQLSLSGLPETLVDIDESAGQRPIPFERLLVTLDAQHLQFVIFYREKPSADSKAIYDFRLNLSIGLISSTVQIHLRVATLLISDHSAVEEPGFT